jgi:ABC-type nickel/cobalt efflux system permease component RcnA
VTPTRRNFLRAAAILLAGAATSGGGRADLAPPPRSKNPFAIAGGEAPGAGASGFAGTILAWQNRFHLALQNAAKSLKGDPGAIWALLGASFAYGVFHAAGPGHGKAVLASYMIASRAALRRGMTLAWLAALLQGLVAIGLVGAAALLLHLTATQMRGAADMLEFASYAAIALLGAWLVVLKARALWGAYSGPSIQAPALRDFRCEAIDDPTHVHTASCGHAHGVDPALLEDRSFSLPTALGAVVAAGARPCSGAILILVFTLAQGLFWAGCAAVLAMAAGTAMTTGALAAGAVYARKRAEAWSRADPRWALVAGRGLELAAAVVVLALGMTLLFGFSTPQGG